MKKALLPLIGITLLFSCKPQLGEGEYLDNKIWNGSKTNKIQGVISLTGERGQFCTGVAISKEIVLTAAHCLQGEDGELKGLDELRVYVGEGSIYDYYGDLEPDSIHIHPDFDYKVPEESLFDFAYIVMKDKVILNESYPSPLMGQRLLRKVFGRARPYHEIFLMGYGQDEDGFSGVKKAVDVYMNKVTEHEFKNTSKKQGDFGGFLSPVKGSCVGDSGGPAFMWLDDELYVIGIAHTALQEVAATAGSSFDVVSGGIMMRCYETNTYGRIDSFMDWFLETPHGKKYLEGL